MAVAPVQDAAGRAAESDDEPTEGRDRRRPSNWVIAGLAIVLVLPLVVGVIGFRSPTWTPVLDLAQTELRVRDVGTSHTPLIGLPGRLTYQGHQGSHPGPLSFYALAPAYRLLGASSWALQVATVLVQALAVVVALLLARRRGGLPLLLGVAAVIAVLVNGFGVTTLTEPWNPYLPLLWWVVVLLAVWSVVCGDSKMMPVALGAMLFCAQTHVPYLALSIGLFAVAAIATFVQYRDGDADRRRAIARWSGLTVGIGVVACLPPVIDQIQNSPGNLAIFFNYLTSPPESADPVAGVPEAVTVVLRHLDVFHLSVDQLAHPGLLVENDVARHPSAVTGTIVLIAWVAAAVVAARVLTRDAALRRLHLVLAVALGLELFAISRIYGAVWFYLVLSLWAIASLMVVATVWTAIAVAKPRIADPDRLARIGLGGLLAVTVVFSVRSVVVAPEAEHIDATVVRELRSVLPGTVAALDHDQRYLVTASDAAYFNSATYGMLNELDRRGFDAGMLTPLAAIATPHRVLSEEEADAKIEIATGKWIDEWRDIPGAREVAFVEPRTPEQKARFDHLHAEVDALLRAENRADLVPLLDLNLFAASIDQDISSAARSRMEEMLTLGVPMAVFIAPVDTRVTP